MGVYPKIADSVYVADGAKLVGDVSIGAQSSVWFNAVLRGDLAPIVIGNRCNIQDDVIGDVHTCQPLVIDDDVSIGHAAIVHGCKIGRGSLIGMGAAALGYLTPVQGALIQEAIDVAVILNALRALQDGKFSKRAASAGR